MFGIGSKTVLKLENFAQNTVAFAPFSHSMEHLDCLIMALYYITMCFFRYMGYAYNKYVIM